MSHSQRYALEFPGLLLELDAESYPGSGDAEVLGDSRWTFRTEDLALLGCYAEDEEERPRYVESSMVHTSERPLLLALAPDSLEYVDEEERAAWDANAPEEERPAELESSALDVCIVALRAFLELGEERRANGEEPLRVRVGWYGECSAFWAFHDITHALEDVDWSGGAGQVYVSGGWAEDRANLEGARRAVRAGVPVAEVLAELAGLRDAFRSRFQEESSALADFLDGYTDTDGEEEHARRVADLAAEVLDALDEGATEEDALETAWEYVDGAAGSMSDEESAAVLVHTEHADRAEEYADGDSVDLASRAFGALLGDVESALLDAFRVRVCAECEERLPADGRRVCADCARGYTDEEREEAEREYREEERAEELDALAEEEADLHAHAREPHAVRVLPLGAERVALLERLAADPDTSPEDRERVRRVLAREHTPEDAERLEEEARAVRERVERARAQDEEHARAVRRIREDALQDPDRTEEERERIRALLRAEDAAPRTEDGTRPDPRGPRPLEDRAALAPVGAGGSTDPARSDLAHRNAHRAERLRVLADPDTSPEGRRVLRVLLERDARELDTPEEERARIRAALAEDEEREHGPRPPGSAPAPYPRTYAPEDAARAERLERERRMGERLREELDALQRERGGSRADAARALLERRRAAERGETAPPDVDSPEAARDMLRAVRALPPGTPARDALERGETAPEDAGTRAPDEDPPRTVHLALFVRLLGARAACGAPVAGLADVSEDLARVTCPDCASRVVQEERDA